MLAHSWEDEKRENTSRHITAKVLKTKDKEKHLKPSRVEVQEHNNSREQ